MDAKPCPASWKLTVPHFLDQASDLVQELKKLDVAALGKLMQVSEKLAEQNIERYRNWQTPFTVDNAHPAIFTFSGDAFVGLDSTTLSPDELAFAQNHLRILSGLYGILRPLDLMQPYRLEMGGRFVPPGNKNLYEFWRDLLTGQLLRELKERPGYIVNLASDEYSSTIDFNKLDAPVITPKFLDHKNGTYKIISSFAKKARGIMARWLIQKRPTSAEDIPSFADNGYAFCQERSEPTSPVFIRGND